MQSKSTFLDYVFMDTNFPPPPLPQLGLSKTVALKFRARNYRNKLAIVLLTLSSLDRNLHTCLLFSVGHS